MAQDREITLRATCRVCKKVEDIPVKESEYIRYRDERPLIQVAFPDLTAAQREIIQSGTCGACFDQMWPEE